VCAELTVTGADCGAVPPSWRQQVEDICLITVGEPSAHVLKLIGEPAPVEVSAGRSARLAVTVGTDSRMPLAAEAHLISPWGTWEWMGPAVAGAQLPPGGSAEIGFDIAPPAWLEPGEWWALIRVGCAGRLIYTPAVKVTVLR